MSANKENVKENRKNSILTKDNFSNALFRIKWIYSYGKKHVPGIVVYTLIGMSGALVTILSSLVSRDLVDIITGHKTGELLKSFIMMIGLQLITVAVNNISSYISVSISTKVDNTIKAEIYDRIMISDWESLSKYHSGNILSRWGGDISAISSGILSVIPNILIVIVRFSMALYMVLKNDATFAIFALVSVPLSFFVSRCNMKRMRDANVEMLTASTKMSTFSQDSFSNVQNVKALDMLKLYSRKLRVLQKDSRDARLKYQRNTIISSLILTLVSQLVTYSTYGWGVYRVWSGVITYGSMTMFLTLSQTLSSSAQNLINVVPNIISLLVSAGRVIEIEDLPKEDYSDDEKVKEMLEEHSKSGVEIQINNVDFEYMNGTKVMEDAELVARPREVIGIVGPSGEGKTTMLRLLLAIVNAKKGEAIIKSAETGEELKLSGATRQLFSYVPQGNTLFAETIAENMRNVKEDATEEEITEALKMACAWDFVSKLPEGINTLIQERGGGISEGQAQRLSIARALIRKSPVLLLDEATSALDVDTQKQVLDNIFKDECSRTVIITTHRPEVMEICDRVYLIKNKELVIREG